MTFTCLRDKNTADISSYTLDELLGDSAPAAAAFLLKCDVEGAEFLVLQGAKHFLSNASPDLLLSVHPPTLPEYGHTKDDVRNFLLGLGYQIEFVAVDHEEHWLCTREVARG